MEMRKFGNTDMVVSVLGFGGAEIGFEKATSEVVDDLLGGALNAGLNVIDTAECYLESEELIGRAVSKRRKEFYLFTKCGHPEGLPAEDWRPESILSSIERSLKRLKTDRIELIQLHSCSEAELKKGDAISALKKARDKGYVRYIGYSGDSKAAKYAIECGEFDALQTSVNLADQEAIELTLPKAQARNMGVIAKRPIANTAWHYPHRPELEYHQPYWDRLQVLNYDFLKGPMTPAVAIALKFTLNAPGVDVAIVGTTKPGRWRENADMLEAGPLSAARYEAIRARWHEVGEPSWTGQS